MNNPRMCVCVTCKKQPCTFNVTCSCLTAVYVVHIYYTVLYTRIVTYNAVHVPAMR